MKELHLAIALIGSTLAIPSKAGGTAGTVPRRNDGGEIIIQGTRDRDKQIRQFVSELTPAPIHGQLARFEEPVCPRVLGLSERQGRELADRMRTVADAAGIPTAKSGCDGNVLLIVTSDKRELIRRLAEEQPGFFPEDWGMSQIRNVADDPSPVAAWQMESILDSDGRSIAQAMLRGSKPTDLKREVRVQRTTTPASRLTPLARRAFWGSVVVIQSSALVGVTPIQLADYAAMRSFIRTDPKRLRPTSVGSILSVIDAPMGTPIPITLTEWDLAYLTSFYASTKNAYAEYQKGQIGRQMKREIQGQHPSGN